MEPTRSSSEYLKQLESYSPVNAGDVYSDLVNRVNAFRPQYEELSGYEQQAYQAPTRLMQQYNTQYGSEAGAGPSAVSRLNAILGDIGRNYGTADVLSNVIQTQRGRIGDIAQDVLNQYNSSRENTMQMYQLANAREEAARARAAAGNGGMGINFPNPYATQEATTQKNPQDLYKALSQIPRIGQKTSWAPQGITAQARQAMVQNILKQFGGAGNMDMVDIYRRGGFSDKANPALHDKALQGLQSRLPGAKAAINPYLNRIGFNLK